MLIWNLPGVSALDYVTVIFKGCEQPRQQQLVPGEFDAGSRFDKNTPANIPVRSLLCHNY